ncbi:hypothetical protein POM88_030457 [Heracleum sosnowskyi]|uniref:Replication protein A 70 kDa DNA-binding subunit B/D first OB fold domain-containing protein n=1 Tax=Heracleum sosnowskyi TaxID=360622 RepID=A0AAD8HWX0_9APIA|nr:hypothetical protein POM88_030457 [Heracleum sosnowskyi]
MNVAVDINSGTKQNEKHVGRPHTKSKSSTKNSGKGRGRPVGQNIVPNIVKEMISRQNNDSPTPSLKHQHSGVDYHKTVHAKGKNSNQTEQALFDVIVNKDYDVCDKKLEEFKKIDVSKVTYSASLPSELYIRRNHHTKEKSAQLSKPVCSPLSDITNTPAQRGLVAGLSSFKSNVTKRSIGSVVDVNDPRAKSKRPFTNITNSSEHIIKSLERIDKENIGNKTNTISKKVNENRYVQENCRETATSGGRVRTVTPKRLESQFNEEGSSSLHMILHSSTVPSKMQQDDQEEFERYESTYISVSEDEISDYDVDYEDIGNCDSEEDLSNLDERHNVKFHTSESTSKNIDLPPCPEYKSLGFPTKTCKKISQLHSHHNCGRYDILYKQRELSENPNLKLNEEQLQNYALAEIERMLNTLGKSLIHFPTIPMPSTIYLDKCINRLILEERSYDTSKMHDEHKDLVSKLNIEQKRVYDAVIQSVYEATLLPGGNSDTERRRIQQFSEWILSLGDGKVTAATNESDCSINVPPEFCIQSETVDINELIYTVFPDLVSSYSNVDYLRERMGSLTYDRLDALDESKVSWTIKVVVTRTWNTLTKETGVLKAHNLILLDDTNNHMHAVVRPEIWKYFGPNIHEGTMYRISNFVVKEAIGKLRPVSSRYSHKVAIWGELAEFARNMLEMEAEQLRIILISSIRILKTNGHIVISCSSSTKVYVNLEYDDVIKMRQRLLEEGYVAVGDHAAN